jgi:hypothetical protein
MIAFWWLRLAARAGDVETIRGDGRIVRADMQSIGKTGVSERVCQQVLLMRKK